MVVPQRSAIGPNTLLCSLERRKEFGKRSALVDHQCFRKRVTRGGVVLRMATTVSWAMSPPSSALDRPSSLLGKAAGAEGPDRAARRHGNGEYLSCGRNIFQQETKLPQPKAIRDVLRLRRRPRLLLIECRFGRYCDQRVYRMNRAAVSCDQQPREFLDLT